MTASEVVLTTARISILRLPSSQEQVHCNAIPPCKLTWRHDKLWVSYVEPEARSHLPALGNEDWLKSCLASSSVRAVCLDPRLDDASLKFWADICEYAEKQVFLRVPSTSYLPQQRCRLAWPFKRLSDWLAAALILLVLSPIMLGLMFLVRATSAGPIFFTQWRVGHRGKLFRVMKFRTMIADAERQHHQVMGNQTGLHKRKDDPRITPIGRWMRKYSLDELPQLFNVLRGEMSLVGPRPWALYDAVRIDTDLQRRLSALPGITGAWQVEARSSLLDLNRVNCRDLQYLSEWSLWQDLSILFRTIPKAIAGTGAY